MTYKTTRKQVGVVLLAVLFVFAGNGLGTSVGSTGSYEEATGQATFTVHIENHDDTAHTVLLVVSHQATPACRNSQPPCAAPTISETIVVEKYKIAAGEQMTVSDIRVLVPHTSFYIDTYTVSLRADNGNAASVTGIATSDTFRMCHADKPDLYKYDFFVSNAETEEFWGRITKDGSVTLTVEPQPILHSSE